MTVQRGNFDSGYTAKLTGRLKPVRPDAEPAYYELTCTARYTRGLVALDRDRAAEELKLWVADKANRARLAGEEFEVRSKGVR